MVKNQIPYRDLGAQHFNRINRAPTANRLVRRLNQLGYNVELRAA